MKKLKRGLILVLSTVLCSFSAMAQVPQAINYQAVARDAGGNLLANTAIGIQLSIHDVAAGGTVLYQEQHTVTTNTLGLFTLQIGNGTPTVGDFPSIYWSVNDKFLEVEMDVNGGTSYSSMGTSQLISVPYSLTSQTAETVGPNATIEPTQLTSGSANVGDILVWDGSNWLPNPSAGLNSWISLGGNHIKNPNTGNVSIDPYGSNIPTAVLDVRRPYTIFATDGTAAFRGTAHTSHFHYGNSEDTYIRGGANGSAVYINDIPYGSVNMVTGGGGLGIGVNSDLSYKVQLLSNFGKGLRVDVNGSTTGSPEGIRVLMSSVSGTEKYGIYSETNALGAGNNWGVFGKASGAAPGYKVGVLGEGAGIGNYTDVSIGVQGRAVSEATNNFGVQGYAIVANDNFNYGVYGRAVGSTGNNGVYWDAHLQGSAGSSPGGNFGIYGSAYFGAGYAGFFDGDVYAYDVYYQSSDSRLKSNVVTIESGLSTVAKLRPVTYNIKESAKADAKFSEKLSYGFIAQEVVDVLPELVVSLIHPVDVELKGDERQLLALNYDGFIPVLTSAIQEQQVIIVQLKTDNENLSAQLQAQALKMDELSKQVQALSKTVSKINNH